LSLPGQKDKFTPELRILVASLLSMGVILIWAKYFGPKPPVQQPQGNRPAVTAPATPGPATSSPSSAAAPATPAAMVAAAPITVTPKTDSQERSIIIENALYRVEISNRGAVVKSWQLKQYKDDCRYGQRTLDLVQNGQKDCSKNKETDVPRETGGWPFSLVLDD
jgi:YidC/Oxa1 family membrane protein insertase